MGNFYLWLLRKIRIVHVRLFDTLEDLLGIGCSLIGVSTGIVSQGDDRRRLFFGVSSAFIDAGTSHPFHSKAAFSRQGITAVASGGYIESSFSGKRIGIGFSYWCIGTKEKETKLKMHYRSKTAITIQFLEPFWIYFWREISTILTLLLITKKRDDNASLRWTRNYHLKLSLVGPRMRC